MKILGVIPARYNSSRFPGKALADIHGKPMVQRVYEQVMKCESIHHVVVATDDSRIQTVLKELNIPVVMTSENHRSGTERCIEVVEKMNTKYSAVINIQGDEPFIHPDQIDEVVDLIKLGAEVASLMRVVSDNEALHSPNAVKVVVDEYNRALYFSRQVVPYLRDVPKKDWLNQHTFYQHVGLYAYRTDALEKIKTLSDNQLEKVESLEQLRWISNGMRISMGVTEHQTHGIDTPEDLEKALAILK